MTDDGESVPDFYKNKSILITGGAGSLGGVLIEKLLRSCPEIKRIYLLLRPKKHSKSTALDRWSEILNTPLFSKLREENSEIFDKIVVVNGDLNSPDLGISKIDEETLINNVSIIFHSAALLKFDATMKESLSVNVIGTFHLLQLCRRLKNIEAFVYVSTFYSTCNHPTRIDERAPIIPWLNGKINYEKIDVDELVKMMPDDLIKQWPNLYTFSKAITEIMLNDQKDLLPISIVRPSMILSTLREPFPGWIDNIYGPTLMALNTMIGLARSICGRVDNSAHVVPADIVVNLVICAAWKTGKQKTTDVMIYNCDTANRSPAAWGQIMLPCLEYSKIYPSTKMIRYPHTTITPYYPLYWIITAIQSYLIAYTYALTTGDSKILRMQKVTSRYWYLVLFFAQNAWIVDDRNVVQLHKELSEIDKNKFLINVEEINWHQYVENYAIGMRVHLLKDNMESLDEARGRLKTLWWREVFIQVFILLMMITVGYIIMSIMIPIMIFPFRNGMENSSVEL